jgi:hypothetical protein
LLTSSKPLVMSASLAPYVPLETLRMPPLLAALKKLLTSLFLETLEILNRVSSFNDASPHLTIIRPRNNNDN